MSICFLNSKLKWSFQYLQRPLLGNVFEVGLWRLILQCEHRRPSSVWTISWTQILIGYYRIFHWVHPYKVVVFLLRQPFRLFHFSKAIVQVFIFFKIFYLFFCRKFRRYSRNLLSAMFLFFSRTFFFINRPMRSKNHSKWKTASIFSQYQIFKRQSHPWIPNFL